MASDEHAEHQRIAYDFTALVEHRLYALARAAAGISTLQVPSYVGVAQDLWILGVVMSALFQQRPHPDSLRSALQLDWNGNCALASRMEYAYAHALALWDQAAATRLDFAWDFTFAAGELLDTSRQEPWPSRPADLPAQFLVAPAYLVENRVYARQRLCTGATFGRL
ncbi:hypothetical protein ACH40F_47925 [Streptomyces sp. NPDC020794]|uniref:hypothetical protein n=1 Tax=unclassified Streptomyces TaxID=2593676 RepID=UPI0036F17145